MSKTSRGKKICGYLKGIRRKIAEENDIKLDIPECTYEGECRGTCPRCEWEVQYLEKTLFERMKLGKIATISGLALGLTSCGYLGFPPFQTSGMVENPDTENIEQADTLPLPPPPSPEEYYMDERNIDTTVIDEDEEGKELAGVVDVTLPQFPGGEEALFEFLANNLKYPQAAKDSNIQGKVYVTFVVEKDGTLTNPRVVRDIGGGCGEEALRVVKMMPKWKPGEQFGEIVRVQYTLPILFELNKSHF